MNAVVGDIGTVESISTRGGVRVGIVAVEGEERTATVLVDTFSGEVLSLEVDSGN